MNILRRPHRLTCCLHLLLALALPASITAKEPPAIDAIEARSQPSETLSAPPPWTFANEPLQSSTWLPAALSQPDQAGSAATVPTQLDAQVADFMLHQKAQRHFQGLYFKSSAARETEDDLTELHYRIEWDLSDNGHLEMKRDRARQINQKELQTLQLLDDVRIHHLNQTLDEIEFLNRAIRYHQAVNLSDLLGKIVQRRRAQLESGYVTRDDYEHIRFKLRQAQLQVGLYADAQGAFMAPETHRLLNCAEYLQLKECAAIQARAVEQAYALRIQENLAQRADFARTWTDDLAVNLYAEQRDRSDADLENNVGIEVTLPLHWYAGRDGLIAQEKALYQRQTRVLKKRIRTHVAKLYNLFHFQQYRIRSLLLELEKITQQIGFERQRARRALQALDYTPERSLERLQEKESELRHDTMLARLKLYEMVAKLMAIGHTDQFTEILAGHPGGCPAR